MVRVFYVKFVAIDVPSQTELDVERHVNPSATWNTYLQDKIFYAGRMYDYLNVAKIMFDGEKHSNEFTVHVFADKDTMDNVVSMIQGEVENMQSMWGIAYIELRECAIRADQSMVSKEINNDLTGNTVTVVISPDHWS